MPRTRKPSPAPPGSAARAARAAVAIITASERNAGRALCGVFDTGPGDIYTGTARTRQETVTERISPPDEQAAFRACKQAWRNNLMLRSISRGKLAFLNYGLKIHCDDAAWLDQAGDLGRGISNETWIANFTRDVWRSRLHFDNVPVVWASAAAMDIPPTVVDIEQTKYTNQFSIESLQYTLPATALAEMRSQAMSGISGATKNLRRAEQIKARLDEMLLAMGVENGVLVLDADSAEQGRNFRVWTQAPSGQGYDWPSLHACMQTVEAYAGMEFGELLLGMACDRVIRYHRLGHEIKSGNFAGSGRHFWSVQADAEITKKLKGKRGLLEMTGNFDHDMETWYPEWERWDARRWEGVQQRINYWAGPIGLLMGITSGSRNPGAIPAVVRMLETEVVEDRQNIGRFIEEVLSTALGKTISVKWGTGCFRDVRVWSEMLKFGASNGATSQTTFQEANDMDPDVELDRKKSELFEAKFRLPLTMPGHGKVNAGANANGRPAGTRDPEGGME